MKIKNQRAILVLAILSGLFFVGCEYVTMSNADPLYVPGSSDVTANATLVELQQGRALYVSNCGTCHKLYLPESYGVSRWKNLLSEMAPNTSLSPAEILLVTKYVCKGKQ